MTLPQPESSRPVQPRLVEREAGSATVPQPEPTEALLELAFDDEPTEIIARSELPDYGLTSERSHS